MEIKGIVDNLFMKSCTNKIGDKIDFLFDNKIVNAEILKIEDNYLILRIDDEEINKKFNDHFMETLKRSCSFKMDEEDKYIDKFYQKNEGKEDD